MRHTRAAGFSIVAAIFLLVVLAALGAFILNVSSNQQIGSALDVQGARAYQAARAGIEWGVFQVQATPAYNFGHAPLPNPNTRACPASPTSFALPVSAVTLSGFTVTVICVRTPVDDTLPNNPLSSPAVYTLTATACNQPNPGCPNITNPSNLYVERRLEVAL